MKKNDPTTYPKWLLKKLADLESDKSRCTQKASALETRLSNLKSTEQHLKDCSWTIRIENIPGGIRICHEGMWKK